MVELPKRKYNRLEGYDYNLNGAYFVTVCAKDRQDLFAKYDVGANSVRPQINNNDDDECFGKLVDSPNIKLSDIGHIIDKSINNIEQIYEDVFIDKYIIMPDHVHIIIVFDRDTNEKDGRTIVGAIIDRPNSGEHCSPLHYPKLSRIIKQWKGVVTKKVGFPIWQKSFYDHIIRNEEDYHMIINYIENNPLKLEMVRNEPFGKIEPLK